MDTLASDGDLVAIVTAMPEELDAILARARSVRRRSRFVSARIGGSDAVLVATGDGSRRAGPAAAALCAETRPAFLLGVGVAGALSPELFAGALIVSKTVRDSRGPAPRPDPALLSRAVSVGGATPATLLTLDRPAVARAEKETLAATLNGDAPAAADMESAAWARAAAAHGAPYLVLRAISDTLEEELPDYLPDCVDESGGIRRASVLAAALARPGTLPTLLKMRRRLVETSERLARFLERFLSQAAR